MDNQLLQAAIDEERQLLARLDAVRSVIRAYGGSPRGAPVKNEVQPPARAPITRSPSVATIKIKNLLGDLLRGEVDPTPTRDLLTFLDGEGIKIGGKNPIATLSALLSHADEFEAIGRKGWLLKSRTPDVATSGADSTDEDATSSIDSLELMPRG